MATVTTTRPPKLICNLSEGGSYPDAAPQYQFITSPSTMRYTFYMDSRHFWTTILAVNSFCWFISIAFLAYGFGMMIVALDWKKFVLAVAVFVALSLSGLVFTGLAHD
jgi:hypothetical protein